MIQVFYAACSTIPLVAAYVVGLLYVAQSTAYNCAVFISLDYQTVIAVD